MTAKPAVPFGGKYRKYSVILPNTKIGNNVVIDKAIIGILMLNEIEDNINKTYSLYTYRWKKKI